MDDKWKIKVYESLSGEKPVEEFIKSQGEKTQLKISKILDLMELYGLEGAHPYAKKLAGTSLWEIRILGGDSIRILYVTMKAKIFLLLHAFKKKSQKTPPKEIVIAHKRLNEFLRRKNGA